MLSYVFFGRRIQKSQTHVMICLRSCGRCWSGNSEQDRTVYRLFNLISCCLYPNCCKACDADQCCGDKAYRHDNECMDGRAIAVVCNYLACSDLDICILRHDFNPSFFHDAKKTSKCAGSMEKTWLNSVYWLTKG